MIGITLLHFSVGGRLKAMIHCCTLCADDVLWLTVASLHILHFTTCWCVLPSTDMVVWQTLQAMTGALLLSGLPCGEYGGGGSPGTSALGNGARPWDRTEGGTSVHWNWLYSRVVGRRAPRTKQEDSNLPKHLPSTAGQKVNFKCCQRMFDWTCLRYFIFSNVCWQIAFNIYIF